MVEILVSMDSDLKDEKSSTFSIKMMEFADDTTTVTNTKIKKEN